MVSCLSLFCLLSLLPSSCCCRVSDWGRERQREQKGLTWLVSSEMTLYFREWQMLKGDYFSCGDFYKLFWGSHANQATTPLTTPVTQAIYSIPLTVTSPLASNFLDIHTIQFSSVKSPVDISSSSLDWLFLPCVAPIWSVGCILHPLSGQTEGDDWSQCNCRYPLLQQRACQAF